jgi:tetratricopeptide (TPR) repeat protein
VLDREAIDEAVARGSDLLKQGKLDDAAKAFRSALLLDEKNPRVLALLGLTYFKSGAFPQAQPIYEELVERAPTDASHRLNLGLVYLKLGESEKAIGALESSRALDPSQGRAVSYLGLAYARAGRYAEAYRSFILAGQNDLASEIEINLTPAERESIAQQLARPEPRPAPPKPPPPKSSAEINLMSMPAIVIDRPPSDDEGAPLTGGGQRPEMSGAKPGDEQSFASTKPYPAPQPSMPEILVTEGSNHSGIHVPPAQAAHDDDADKAFSEMAAVKRPEATPAPKPGDILAPAMSDSQQFVLPERTPVPVPADGQSMISKAVEVAVPSSSATAGIRVTTGATPPVPLSQLATDSLVRVEEEGELFEVTAHGELVIRVVERTVTRLEGIHISGGELEYEPATRRSRGSQTEEKFDYGGSRFHVVSGKGYLIAVPGDKKFTAVTLDDDIFYLREDLVYAFDATLRWENGNVPGLRGKLPIVQFRGDGAVALRTSTQLVRVKLPAQGVVYIDAARLAGWIGRVIPRAVVPPKHGPMGEICVECTGEGVVLVDPSGVLPPMTTSAKEGERRPPPPAGSRGTTPPPPPQKADDASGPIELDVVKKADWLSDEDGEGSGQGGAGQDSRDEM